jgi:hypothetical protein
MHHPLVAWPRAKEPHFFDMAYTFNAMSKHLFARSYGPIFPRYPSTSDMSLHVTGEATPAYILVSIAVIHHGNSNDNNINTIIIVVFFIVIKLCQLFVVAAGDYYCFDGINYKLINGFLYILIFSLFDRRVQKLLLACTTCFQMPN